MRYVESLNMALHQMMRDNDRLYVLGEDIVDPYGGAFKVTQGLHDLFPYRVLSTPISEAAIVGVATGLALRGLLPIVEIMFGDFLTLCADQVINGAAKFSWMYNDKVEVPLTIRTPMGGRRGYGPTHSQTLESMFLSTPGLTIIAPSEFHDPGNLLKAAVLHTHSPVLFVENKSLYPQELRLPNDQLRVGDFHAITETTDKLFPTVTLTLSPDKDPDATIIAYGGMASLAANVAHDLFMRDETCIEVVIPACIKPLPDLTASVFRSGKAIIAEEGCRTGGWGAELAATLTEQCFANLDRPILRVAALDLPIPSAVHLEQQVLPSQADIEKAVCTLVSS